MFFQINVNLEYLLKYNLDSFKLRQAFGVALLQKVQPVRLASTAVSTQGILYFCWP